MLLFPLGSIGYVLASRLRVQLGLEILQHRKPVEDFFQARSKFISPLVSGKHRQASILAARLDREVHVHGSLHRMHREFRVQSTWPQSRRRGMRCVWFSAMGRNQPRASQYCPTSPFPTVPASTHYQLSFRVARVLLSVGGADDVPTLSRLRQNSSTSFPPHF